MLRISVGVSLCFTLLAVGGSLAACSSDSASGGSAGKGGTESEGGSGSNGGTGGKGSVITGGKSSDGGSGGGRAGGSTGGTDSACSDTVVCVDADTAATCDPLTGETSNINCKDDLAELGITSTGCEGDATMGNCNGDLSDAECEAGATAFAVCGMFTNDQFLNTYVNCFQNNEGQDGQPLRPVIICGGKFLDEEAMTVDCDAAQAECFEGGAGGDGAGGAAAGGAPG